MFEMTPAELYALAATDPTTATAVATVALVDTTAQLVEATVGLVEATRSLANTTKYLAYATYGLVAVGLGQIAVVWHGINEMSKATRIRAAEQDQRHAEVMEQLRQSSKALDSLIRRNRPDRRAVRRSSP